MRVSIIRNGSIRDFIFPNEAKGSYWIDGFDINGNKRNITAGLYSGRNLIAYGGAALGVIMSVIRYRAGSVSLAGCLFSSDGESKGFL